MTFSLRIKDGSLQYLLCGQKYSVGRGENREIRLQSDKSLNRKHAVLVVKDDEVILTDRDSKYYTFVNDKKLEPFVEVILKSGDVIKFGAWESVFTFEQINIITTTSDMDCSEQVQRNLYILGGSYHLNWKPQFTHLTTDQIRLKALSSKILCAIITGIPIVTPKYWDDYVECVYKNLPPPDVTKYRPPCVDSALCKDLSLEFKIERQSLFKNKVFVFSIESEKDEMVDMIKLAGGEAISLDITPVTEAEQNESTKTYILVKPDELTDDELDDSHLQFKAKLAVPCSDIGVAIVQCTLDIYGDRHKTKVKPAIVPQAGEHDVIMDQSPTKEVESCQKEVEANVTKESESVEDVVADNGMEIDQTPLLTKDTPNGDDKSSSE